jgi:3-methyladenine DNA glycosylase Tag
VLEINQAGLSWETILKKREGFRAAYDGFDVDAWRRMPSRTSNACCRTRASSATG